MTKVLLSEASRSEQLSHTYQQACLAEMEAIKPGNVHMFADGHGMKVQDFIQSAAASAKVIVLPNLTLGERIYRSVEVTRQTVGCNTNLGIVLLCAPVIQAALEVKPSSTKAILCQQLAKVLATSSQSDAQWAFKAIQLASPGGLGHADAHDVKKPVTCTLLEAMQPAVDRDFIALQYSNGFQHIVREGLQQYQQALSLWENASWAMTMLYLYWLSHYPDSHIMRKYSLDVAEQVQREAMFHYQALQDQKNPKLYFPPLLQFDTALKKRQVNPGTSADLSVATLLLYESIK